MNANTAGEEMEDKGDNRLLSFFWGGTRSVRNLTVEGNGKGVMREVHRDQRNNGEAKK